MASTASASKKAADKKKAAAEPKGKAAAPAPAARRSTRAIDNPTSLPEQPVLHSDEIYIPNEDVDIASEIQGTTHAIRAAGGDVEQVIRHEKWDHDLLLIRIAEPGTEQEQQIAVTTVNNRVYEIPRGRPVRVPRFVVEALAHAKQANYKTHRSLPGDPRHMTPVRSTVFSYPFNVLRDPAGLQGEKWLRNVMNDPF